MTELGQKLKEAREAKGLSIDQLHEITKIQKRHLVAIEEGNYDVLPGAFYARAFIKQYADAVGLNGEELLVEHQSTIPQSERREVPQVSTGQKTQETMQKSSSWPVADHMPKILVALLVIAVGVVIWFVFQALTGKDDEKVPSAQSEKIEVQKAKDSPLDTKKAEEPKKEEPKKEEPKKEEPKKEEPKKEEQPAPPTGQQEVKVVGTTGKVSTLEIHNNKTLELEISAKGASYVDVKDDAGNEILNTTVQSGQTEKRDVSTLKEVRLNIGSAPNVEIKLNGQVLAFPLDPQKEYHQRLVIKNQGIEQPAQ
ncbi:MULTISPECIES: helix-turn-helix domain-containing protein [Bacillus]|uniref:Helix-turn-helix domain-containing protein n=1 Tax=Bacillus cereus TaxID=1396 RepID=A0ABD7DG47_BACCE|nr:MULTISPECIES: helix-turn-helix domain-containing protein [Bacillus cereus group]AND09118.1 transcriptional regulator [Bacillus thuringiensis serovar alesti]KAA0828532.1 helix-turn-helix domain-containing protein [Bacillus sp. AY2-1]KAB2391438.1 helix-turn-helix domain-containing protein [Bacillus cereus]KAB5659256.1 helix-turn-helix domain-containing protein [Bacillus thuringiensis]MBJ7934927.1 helix-turn-helix domain-containing protein [Bacillus cereus]